MKFSQASGLEANLDKSNVYFCGVSNVEAERVRSMLGMAPGEPPFR